jgi:hypothetical protein
MTSGRTESSLVYTNNVYQGGMDIFGNVGIGTSTPYSRLTVWGSDTAAGTAALTVANSASTTEFQVFDNGAATLAGTLTQNSDQRLKTNVQSLDASSSLQSIMGLNPVTFNWIDPSEGNTQQFGLIAQQVQQIFPQLVSTTSATALTPGGTLGVNYIGLIAPIIESIKELGIEVQGFAQSITTSVLNATTGNFNNVCVKKASDGSSVCITGDQLEQLLQQSGQSSNNVTTTTFSNTTAPTSPDTDASTTSATSTGATDSTTPLSTEEADATSSSIDSSSTPAQLPDTVTSATTTSPDDSSPDSSTTTPASQ